MADGNYIICAKGERTPRNKVGDKKGYYPPKPKPDQRRNDTKRSNRMSVGVDGEYMPTVTPSKAAQEAVAALQPELGYRAKPRRAGVTMANYYPEVQHRYHNLRTGSLPRKISRRTLFDQCAAQPNEGWSNREVALGRKVLDKPDED